ncbi:IS66 family insertion sequence element accessory protein TnpB [Brucella pseudintermedia]|uniref:IS66 family insertion sequence element accessory protein TnpB n=1 Tax=Brucella pseudintermedia TaxID=370111 RepID=UPI0030F470DD
MVRALQQSSPAQGFRISISTRVPEPKCSILKMSGFYGATPVRVYLACGVTDMRKGIEGLSMLAQDVLRQKPTGGAVFAFRGRRGDRVKLLYFDGQGFCLYYKILQKGRFPWPSAADGTARLTAAQLAMLWEGIDWRRPDWGAPPARVG